MRPALGLGALIDAWVALSADRTVAEAALTTGQFEDGAFCFRRGSGGKLVLCVLKNKTKVTHFHVVDEGGGRVKLAEAKAGGAQSFDDVHCLVAYFSENHITSTMPLLVGCVPLPPSSVGGAESSGTAYATPSQISSSASPHGSESEYAAPSQIGARPVYSGMTPIERHQLSANVKEFGFDYDDQVA